MILNYSPGQPIIRREIFFDGFLENTATVDQDFRKSANLTLNISPWIVPYNSEIYQVILYDRQARNWTGRVAVNNASRLEVTKASGQTTLINVPTTPVAVNQGDLIRLRFVYGTEDVSAPSIQINLRERL